MLWTGGPLLHHLRPIFFILGNDRAVFRQDSKTPFLAINCGYYDSPSLHDCNCTVLDMETEGVSRASGVPRELLEQNISESQN